MKPTTSTVLGLAWVFCLGVLLLYTRIFIFNDQPVAADSIAAASAIHWYDKLILSYGLISYVVLWFWMLTHYFKNRPKRWSIFWGLSLIFTSPIVLLFYFFIIFIPSNKKQVARV